MQNMRTISCRKPPSGLCCFLLVSQPEGRPTSSSLTFVHVWGWSIDLVVNTDTVFNSALSQVSETPLNSKLWAIFSNELKNSIKKILESLHKSPLYVIIK